MNNNTNIILITIDSLRDFDYKSKFEKVFEKYTYSLTGYTSGLPTPYAFISILNGIYPFKFDLKFGAQHKIPTLAQVLLNNHYTTAAFVDTNAFVSKKAGYDKGFEYFYEFPIMKVKKNLIEKNIKQRVKKMVPDVLLENIKKWKRWYTNVLWAKKAAVGNLFFGVKNIIDYAFSFIKEVSKSKHPYFLWIYIVDVHWPYISTCYDFSMIIRHFQISYKVKKVMDNINVIRRDFFRNLDPFAISVETIEKLLKKNMEQFNKIRKYKEELLFFYHNAIIEVENNIVNFIDKVWKISPNTVFFITSDHGEEFFEKGFYEHQPAVHNKYTIKVPIIIVSPERLELNIKGVVSNIDIPPTILDFVGIKSPEEWDGYSLIRMVPYDRVLYTISSFAYMPFVRPDENIPPEKFIPMVTAIRNGALPCTVIREYYNLPGSYPYSPMCDEALMFARRLALKAKLKKKIFIK